MFISNFWKFPQMFFIFDRLFNVRSAETSEVEMMNYFLSTSVWEYFGFLNRADETYMLDAPMMPRI